jgi:hypothetical protein
MKLIRKWFSKTERSFYTLCILSLIIYKLNDIYPNYLTYALCAGILIIWLSFFGYQIYNIIKNRNK